MYYDKLRTKAILYICVCMDILGFKSHNKTCILKKTENRKLIIRNCYALLYKNP